MADISITRGDDVGLGFTFKDVDGDPMNITGSTVFITVKRSIYDTDDEAVIAAQQASHTDPLNGKTVISLSHSQTDVDEAIYIYDLQVVAAGGGVSSTKRANFEVEQDVTRRTS